jgi:hypothetical protein
MNYEKIYNILIDNAKNRQIDGYTESHHVIPKSMGGSDDKENLVLLTAREHYIAHNLLHRIYKNAEMRYAFVLMVNAENKRQQRDYKITSRMYETAKRLNSEETSRRCLGKQKHNVGKIKCHDPISGKVRMVFPEQIPEGYKLGDGGISSKLMAGKYRGRKYYHNPETGSIIHIDSDQTPPDGYVIGNPNAAKGNEQIKGFKEWINPITGECIRSLECPEGFVKSNTFKKWITDGVSELMVNILTETIPEGWKEGRSKEASIKRGKSRKENASKPIHTPLGIFNHPLRFCEKYNLDISFFASLDGKISYGKMVKNQPALIDELTNVGYDFNRTKFENGFYFIKD